MNSNKLIFRNVKNNIKTYYLYIFALTFSVALYFTFVTLQYDPSMDEVKGSIKGGAAIQAGSVLLVVIVAFFLIYANTIFIKRRSKEIGLLQLIGMTKKNIFHILSIENIILYFSSIILGSALGFAISKLMMMILFRLTGVDDVATLHFSIQALVQTLIVFFVIYIFIMIMNYTFIKRQSILTLFHTANATEDRVKKVSTFEIIIGITGILLIAFGYVLSSKLFGGLFVSIAQLSMAMITILASVILGTYLLYKGSVSFIANMIRKKKNGYLTVNDVLSLSAIMFRMKSNALLLTIITTVSALAIGLLSLSYISYYSAEKTAKDKVPDHFAMADRQEAEQLMHVFEQNGITYYEKTIDVIQIEGNIKNIIDSQLDETTFNPEAMPMPVISEKAIDGLDLSPKETLFTGYHNTLKSFMPLKPTGEIELKGKHEVIPQTYIGLRDGFILPWYFTGGGSPTAIVDETIFEKLRNDLNEDIQLASTTHIGINIEDKSQLKQANELFQAIDFNTMTHESQYELISQQKNQMGLIMFIVGFLGLTFLITSGCILYFKQMDESEQEKPNYTILRKLGFTEFDLLKGIQVKQLFNFGIPLIIGLSHSYFAVRSGWFFFGTELWTPMLIVMVLYTILYSIFGLLSMLYDKKVIKDAL